MRTVLSDVLLVGLSSLVGGSTGNQLVGELGLVLRAGKLGMVVGELVLGLVSNAAHHVTWGNKRERGGLPKKPIVIDVVKSEKVCRFVCSVLMMVKRDTLGGAEEGYLCPPTDTQHHVCHVP